MEQKHCAKSVQIWSDFWSVFSLIRTEYGEILRISLHSIRMRENMDQKSLRIWTLFKQCKYYVSENSLELLVLNVLYIFEYFIWILKCLEEIWSTNILSFSQVADRFRIETVAFIALVFNYLKTNLRKKDVF